MRTMRRLLVGTVLVATPLVAASSTSMAAGSDCTSRAAAALKRCAHASSSGSTGSNKLRFFTTTSPTTDPALHGTQPHGQGTVAAIDLVPSSQRPLTCDPASTTGCNPETIVVGRSRAIQRPDGSFHGHITIAAIAGNEILGVDTNPGQTKAGPLDQLQQAVLTPLCNMTAMSVCLGVVTADSATTATGSTNHFETANLALGAPPVPGLPAAGISASAASSDGNLSTSGQCQTGTGDSRVANATVAGTVLANLIESSTTSTACANAAPTQTNTSSVIGLGGVDVPLPAPGCADGTANTSSGIPTLLPIVCNADDGQPGSSGNPTQATAPYGVREALDVFIGALGPMVLAKVTTGASESLAVAPPAPQTCPAGQTGTPPNCVPTPPGTCPAGQTGTPPNCVPTQPVCNANGDNDCVTGNGPTGPSIPEGAAEDKARDCASGVTGEGNQNCPGANGAGNNAGQTRCNSNGDNDCVNGSGPFGPRLPEGGAVDRARDCAEGGANEGGPTSCPSGASAARTRSSLPFTGLDLIPLGIAGLVLLSGGGMLLRRRGGAGRVD